MPINIPAHTIDNKRELGLIWATDKENESRAAQNPPLEPLTPKQYWAQVEDGALKSFYRAKVQEMGEEAAATVRTANPEDA